MDPTKPLPLEIDPECCANCTAYKDFDEGDARRKNGVGMCRRLPPVPLAALYIQDHAKAKTNIGTTVDVGALKLMDATMWYPLVLKRDKACRDGYERRRLPELPSLAATAFPAFTPEQVGAAEPVRAANDAPEEEFWEDDPEE